MNCPRCGYENLLQDECPKCGIFVSKYIDALNHKKDKPIDPSPLPKFQLSDLFSEYRKPIFLISLLLFSVLSFKMLINILKHSSNLTRLEILIGIGLALKIFLERLIFEKRHKQRTAYYREEYLKSDDWKRKRGLVLQRDGHKCVYCGASATQVHHQRYAPRNIGKEPIEWLVAVCDDCHRRQHGK